MSTPSRLQSWADEQKADLTDIQPYLKNVADCATALHTKITAFHESPGTLSHSDQTALDGVLETSTALVGMVQAISVAPPAPVAKVPATPSHGLFGGPKTEAAQARADQKAADKQEAAEEKAADKAEADQAKAEADQAKADKAAHKHGH